MPRSDRSTVRLRRAGGWLPRATSLALLSVLVPLAPAGAQEWRDFRAARQATGFASLDVEIVYGVGRLTVGRSARPFLYDVNMRYDGEHFAPVRVWSTENDHGKLRIALTSADHEDEDEGRVRIHLDDFDFDLNLDDLKRSGHSEGSLDLELHPGIPMDLRIRAGAADNELDLGGLSLTSLDVATGASKTRLSFDEANLTRMGQLTLRAGAAEFRAEKLGNARFDELRFEGGVGDVTLDFTGVWETNATASIHMKLGGLKLRLPSDLGVRIHRKSFFLAFDAEGFNKIEDAYETANWDTAEARIEIDLDAAVGTVSVELVP